MKLLLGKMEDKLKELEDNSVDSVVTDPPYGISFMGKGWDHGVPDASMWKEVFRVLKPGGHVVSFSSARTYHRSTVAIEDAGFEIRDQLMWVYGSGFPKSHNIGKTYNRKFGDKQDWTIDWDVDWKTLGDGLFEHPETGKTYRGVPDMRGDKIHSLDGTVDRPIIYSLIDGEQENPYTGWGTALKPSHEPITLARKPLSEKTVVANSIKWGLGGVNIDASRLPDENRWPANFIHDGCFDQADWGKYFYVPKVSKKDRNEGLDHLEPQEWKSTVCQPERDRRPFNPSQNTHPTVKPTDLMHYLIRLITPAGGLVLDPFMGSGSTGKAAVRFGYDFVGIEMEPQSFDVAKARIEHEL